MKKNLLILSLSGIFSLSAQSVADGIFVGDNAEVYVKTKTLLFSKGGLDVSTTGELTSKGNVQLEGALKNAGDGSNVSFDYSSGGEDTAYGQLQINGASDASTDGVITMMTNSLNLQQDNVFPEIAFPFKTNFLTALKESSIGTSVGDIITEKTRYKSYAFYLDNKDFTVEAIKSSSQAVNIPASSVFSINIGKLTGTHNFANFTISGIPQSAESVFPIQPSLTGFTDLATNVKRTNKYSESYGKLMADFVDDTSKSTWGHNNYVFGNPFTQNLDLFTVFNDSGLTPALVKGFAITAGTSGKLISSGAYSGERENLVGNFNVVTCASGASDFSAASCSTSGTFFGIIRPLGAFYLKLDDAFTGTTGTSMKFLEGSKTFSYQHLALADPSAGKKGYQNKSPRVAPQKAIEELKLSLNENNIAKSKVALSANPWADSDIDEQLDAVSGVKNRYKTKQAALFLLNEQANSDNSPLLAINGFNMNTHRGKPLNVLLNTVAGQSYSLEASVRIINRTNINNSNFFIEDKKENKIMRVGSDFSYPFTASDNDQNRFVAYYGALPVDTEEQPEKPNAEKSQAPSVDIARNANDENVIVFKGQKGNANIYVYNNLGQLIIKDQNVSTSINYPLNQIPEGGAYRVKIIDSQGKTVTKQIVR